MAEDDGPVLVTGGSRGIGAAVAVALAERGRPIAIAFKSDTAGAGKVVDRIRSTGGRATAYRADIAAEQDVVALFRAIDHELGPLTGLVNNAGITGGFARVESLSAATLAAVMGINVVGAFYCAREAVRRMSTRRGGHGGSIVNVSSRAAQIGGGGEWVHYAASKGALDALTIGLAREVAGEGIRVNAVSPGIIATDLHAAAGDAGRPTALAPQIPLGRAGTAEEVAEAVAWLMSPAAAYVTGAIVPVSGGR